MATRGFGLLPALSTARLPVFLCPNHGGDGPCRRSWQEAEVVDGLGVLVVHHRLRRRVPVADLVVLFAPSAGLSDEGAQRVEANLEAVYVAGWMIGGASGVGARGISLVSVKRAFMDDVVRDLVRLLVEPGVVEGW